MPPKRKQQKPAETSSDEEHTSNQKTTKNKTAAAVTAKKTTTKTTAKKATNKKHKPNGEDSDDDNDELVSLSKDEPNASTKKYAAMVAAANTKDLSIDDDWDGFEFFPVPDEEFLEHLHEYPDDPWVDCYGDECESINESMYEIASYFTDLGVAYQDLQQMRQERKAFQQCMETKRNYHWESSARGEVYCAHCEEYHGTHQVTPSHPHHALCYCQHCTFHFKRMKVWVRKTLEKLLGYGSVEQQVGDDVHVESDSESEFSSGSDFVSDDDASDSE